MTDNPEIEFVCPVCKTRFRRPVSELEEVDQQGFLAPAIPLNRRVVLFRAQCPACGRWVIAQVLVEEE